MKLLLLTLFLCAATYAQTISGNVYSATDGQPVEGASVYLDGTTIAATTNAEGYFSITTKQQYNVPLVVSVLGHNPYRLDNPYTAPQPVKIILTPNSVNLSTVVVTKKVQPFRRQDMMKAFKEQFVGTSMSAHSSIIINENDIYLRYDDERHVLIAEADKPIIVRNSWLKYDISYDLQGFEVAYTKTSIDPVDIVGTTMAGFTRFRDLNKDGAANKNRKAVYYGCVPHLLRTMRNNTWERAKLVTFLGSFTIPPAEIVTVTDTAGLKKVKLLPEAKEKFAWHNRGDKNLLYRLNIADAQGRHSYILFRQDEFVIDPTGKTTPLDALIFGGYMGSLKVGDMLPSDYVYYD